MKLVFGSLQLKIKHTYVRDGQFYFQRAVPDALKGRYPGATIKRNLKTADPIRAAKMVDQLVRAYDAEWAGLLAAPDSSPTALKVHADDFLKRFGLAPHGADNDEDALDQLHDYIDQKRARYAGGDERTYRGADPDEYLSPVELEAGRRLHGTRRATLQDAFSVYLQTHRKRDEVKFTRFARRVFDHLISVTGDKEIAAFTRLDARNYVESCLGQGSKTGTIRRRLNTITAVWRAYRLERDPATVNPFESLAIPGEGKDAEERIPYDSTQLTKLYAACRSEDDDMRWIIALTIDTGARLAEIVGLALDDIKLDAAIPHMVIRPHPWRDIKKQARAIRAPIRSVPLVGASLWAAKRVVERAHQGQKLAFPRYTDERECRSTHASNALNKWVRSLGIDHVMHELRHTLKDRLREVQCPKEINDSIHSHGKADVGDQYGLGYKLPVKLDWMARVAMLSPPACSTKALGAPAASAGSENDRQGS